MTSRKQTLILGYARRMRAVAEMAQEMNDIDAKFLREFGHPIQDDLVEGIAGSVLAGMAARLRQEQGQEPENVSEEPRNAQPQRSGAALVVCGYSWEGPFGDCETHVCGVLPGHTIPHRCATCKAMSILNLGRHQCDVQDKCVFDRACPLFQGCHDLHMQDAEEQS